MKWRTSRCLGSNLFVVPLNTYLVGRCQLSPVEASHNLWCYMMALGVVMAAEDAPDMLVLLACILCACVAGVVLTLAYGACIHAKLRREYHIYTVKKHASEVVEIEESPMPTRSARLMSSESHRRMAQSIRARRRGW